MRVAPSPAARRTTPRHLSSFAPTMAAGILSLAASAQGQSLLSWVLLAFALVAIGLAIVRDVRAIAAGGWQGSAPLILFTWVAACGVLGQRLGGTLPFTRAGFALLAFAGFVAALVMLTRLQRSAGTPATWSVTGSWLLATVALQSISITSSDMHIGALDAVAIAAWVAGLLTYAILVVLILRRITSKEVGWDSLTPDYWIAMGALAISTVAATHSSVLAPVAPAVWAAAALWIPYLLLMELARLRRRGLAVRYDLLRWSTVFPLGMFSEATHSLRMPAFASVAEVFLWAGVAVAAWNLIAAARHLRSRQVVS